MTPAFIREFENGQKLTKAFEAACEKHSEIAARFHDAFIYVGFLPHIPIQQRLSVVPEVVHELRQHSENSRGYIEVPRKLRRVLREILVTHGVSDGPGFGVIEMTKRTEEIFGEIEKKCTQKDYVSSHPIELLAYYISQPSSDRVNWQSEFHNYVLKIFPDCPFERIWIYDHWSKSIKYAYPAP